MKLHQNFSTFEGFLESPAAVLYFLCVLCFENYSLILSQHQPRTCVREPHPNNLVTEKFIIWIDYFFSITDLLIIDLSFKEDIFKLGASAAGTGFCELVQVRIDVYNLHHKYQFKPHL